jgi:hypothetical protein
MTDEDDTTIDLSKLGADDADQGGSSSDEGGPAEGNVLPPEDDGSLKEVGASSGNEEFKIHHLDMGHVESVSDDEVGKLEAVSDGPDVSAGPASKVKVKFDKFITLVATHTYEDILRKNADEDVIISTNLLTDLANAHEESNEGGKKLPFLFVIGILLGVAITWVILKT